MTANQELFDQRMREIDSLVAKIEQCSDPAAQEAMRELVRALLDVHAAGLARVLQLLSQAGDQGRGILGACAEDTVVKNLLLLHGLHPEDLETRVQQALDQVRPHLRSHGGDVELLGVESGTVRLRLQGHCDGCPSSRVTLHSTVEQAIYDAAPDVAAVEVEGITDNHAPSDLVQLDLCK
jgi:Fe-S cluster biogenesis protein NfuA